MTSVSPAQSVAYALEQIAKAFAASDVRRAYEIANTVLVSGLAHPKLYNTRAVWFAQRGRDDLALADFQRSLALAPKDILTLNAAGLCLMRLQQFDQAAAAFGQAIVVDPANAQSHFRKGRALASAGKADDAEAALKQAALLDPANGEAMSSLASIAIGKGDLQTARFYSEQALGLNPADATAAASLASIDISQGEFAAAEHRIRTVLGDPKLAPQGRAVAQGLLGDALDGQDKPAEAFAAYLAEKNELQQIAAPMFAGKRRAVEVAEDLFRYFSDAPPGWLLSSAPSEPSPDEPETHVFLVGFLRTGSTLLEQILQSHPDISALDERDCLAEQAERYLVNYAGLQRFGALTGEALARERTAYWTAVRAQGVDLGKPVFVDKLPLNTIKLPLIAKLFPRAKILFTVRDPRDVILSCLRRHFATNGAMFEMLTLEGAARFYDAVMQIGELSRSMVPLPFVQHRYEDLIDDFEGSVSRVCDFVGVPWQDKMRDFSRTAPTQPILSPSGQQVKRPLYTDSVSQWRRYAEQLAPVMATLQPWIDRLGYPAAQRSIGTAVPSSR